MTIQAVNLPYTEIVGALVQAAVQFEMARREHERMLSECARVRREIMHAQAVEAEAQATAPEGMRVIGILGAPDQRELDLALAAERQRRAALAKAESVYKDAARVVTDALEGRSHTTERHLHP